MAYGGFSLTQQDCYAKAKNCDKEYPGDRACDELREFGYKYLASVVSFSFIKTICMMCFAGD